MKWTNERPTTIGKYWFRPGGKLMRCIMNIWTIDKVLFTDYDGGAALSDSYFNDGLWGDSPIPEPDGCVMIQKPLWCVKFRYIPPYMMHAPRPSIEGMGIRADSADEAWSKFLSNVPLEQHRWYAKEEIYLTEKLND